MPESVTYLVAKGRLREAKEILQAAAKLNGIRLPAEYDLTGEDEKLLGTGITDVPESSGDIKCESSVVNAMYAVWRSTGGVVIRLELITSTHYWLSRDPKMVLTSIAKCRIPATWNKQ